jgi:hypothetical protein
VLDDLGYHTKNSKFPGLEYIDASKDLIFVFKEDLLARNGRQMIFCAAS